MRAQAEKEGKDEDHEEHVKFCTIKQEIYGQERPYFGRNPERLRHAAELVHGVGHKQKSMGNGDREFDSSLQKSADY